MEHSLNFLGLCILHVVPAIVPETSKALKTSRKAIHRFPPTFLIFLIFLIFLSYFRIPDVETHLGKKSRRDRHSQPTMNVSAIEDNQAQQGEVGSMEPEPPSKIAKEKQEVLIST
jgi:hypothetical protein